SRRQLHREGEEQNPRLGDLAAVPRQPLQRVGVPAAGEELVGVARVAGEQALQILRGQILRVVVEEISKPRGTMGGHAISPSSRPTLANASSANCSSSRVCVAVTIGRTRALSRATVGNAMP